ncbi:myosin-10 isoform X1 [Quillaja saponaria]|uniref:Myosin-10 isoform X1 n=1 Tax=Quillaja saponaria TaxID=32244 RepID=A0AAD7P815_QUISA|nr:myosin-10 isoform X1 [Quillaja saponaria]
MSENHDAEQDLEVSGAVGNQEHEVEGNPIENEHLAPVLDSSTEMKSEPDATQMHESSAGTSGDEVMIGTPSGDTAESINQMDRGDTDNGVLRGEEQGDPDDEKVRENNGKDDMFVDCPDELITVDGRNAASKEAVAAAETEENLEENHVPQQHNHFNETENGLAEGYLINELEHLRAMLEKTAGQKESIIREYQEERETLANGVLTLHSQLKALNRQQPLLGGNEGDLVDRIHKAKVRDREEDTQVADASLREIINECLQFIKTTSEEHLQTEATIRDLHSTLVMKDQEIEDLNSKVTEFSISNDVVASYVNSVQMSAEVSSEIQLEQVRHIEAVTDRTLASLATLVNQEQLRDATVSGKVIHIEKGTSLLIEKYNQILFEINRFGQSLSEIGVDIIEQDHETLFGTARVQLLELKRKEFNLIENLGQLEDRNQKLVEQLDNKNVIVETLNAELGKIKMELEQEKVKSANTKEKLSKAVTKGKALVQQRESLKDSLADKTGELEKCLTELQEKSSALEAADRTKVELLQSESMVATLQELLSQSNKITEKVEEILSQTSVPEKFQSLDTIERFRWLVDDRDVLKGVFLEFHKLKDALALINLPDTVSSSNLDSQINWLGECCSRANDEINVLHHGISATREAARNEIDRLSASLSAELQEKDYLQMELTDLKCKYEEIVGKNHHGSLERDQIVKMLLELSGLKMEDEGFDLSSDVFVIINRCFEAINEKSLPVYGSVSIDANLFERILSVLYIRNQELMLCEDILEEEMPIRLEVNKLSNELKVKSEELLVLKEEKSSLQKDFEKSEGKAAVLRDKLTMAVKKGKGLVQDRENLKALLSEKKSEIEQLKLDLQSQESAVVECRNQIDRLSTDVGSIPKLEANLVALKGERDRFEQFLLESNKMLQGMIEAIDGIVIPGNSCNEEPVEKVKWLAGFFSESQNAKVHAEQDFRQLKEEAETLASKLSETQAIVRSLEEALADAEYKISEFVEEKRELELGKENIEQELQRVKEEVSSLTFKLAEASTTTKSIEDALSMAENDISVLSNEKEQAQVSKAAAETELEKVKEEAAALTSKLEEASKTINSLEDALSQAEGNVILLTEQYNGAQVVKTNMENELKKLQEEAELQSGKLLDACATIKSLEDALLKAQGDISVVEGEKRSASEEIFSLNSKLNACMEELAGRSDNLKSRSVEIIGQLDDLQMLMKDDTLLFRVKECFEKKYESLKNMDPILRNIRDHIVNMIPKDLQTHAVIEDDSQAEKNFLGCLENFDVEVYSGEVNDVNTNDISSYIRKNVEGFQLRNKIIEDNFDRFSYFIDEYISSVLGKLLATENDITSMSKHMEALKEKVRSMEIHKQDQENTISILENDVKVLLSACTDATKELQIEVENENNSLARSSIPELETLKYGADAHQQRLDGTKYDRTVEKLISATGRVCSLIKEFGRRHDVATGTIEDLQNKLKETQAASEKFVEERGLNQNRVSQLESEIQVLQNSCSELRLNLDDYHAKEEKLKGREAELSSSYNSTLTKEQEIQNSLLSASEVKALFEKIDELQSLT